MPRDTRSRMPPFRAPLLDGVTPVAYRTIAEQVAHHIRRAIAEGKIRPGERLLEVATARQMKTSRAPIREALAQLQREGLVVKTPNRGARVVELTEDMVRGVASLRGVLEGFAAYLAVDQLAPADYAALQAIVTEMERAARREAFAEVIELDYEFHAFICRASGHSILYDVWSGMDGKVRLFLSATNLMYRDMKAIVRGHQEILDALRRRDKARASRVMGDHLGEVVGLFLTKVIQGRPARRASRSPSARHVRRAGSLAAKRRGR